MRVLIVGAGFAGTWAALAARALLDREKVADARCEIAVLAPECKLVLHPRLSERESRGMQVSLAPLFAATAIRFVPGLAWRVNSELRQVSCVNDGSPFSIRYDRLVLANGPSSVLSQLPGMREFGYNIETVDSAARLEAHYERLMWRSTNWVSHTVVVVGGVLTGTEVAAALVARLAEFDRLMGSIKVILVEQCPEIAPSLVLPTRRIVVKSLKRMGIDCRTETRVTRVTPEGVVLESGEFLSAAMTIWAGGSETNVLNGQLPWAKDARKRIIVGDDLAVLGIGCSYVAGTNAHQVRLGGIEPAVAGVGHAILAGRIAGNNAAASLVGARQTDVPEQAPPAYIDLGRAGALVASGCGKTVRVTGQEARVMRHELVTKVVYPPPARRDRALQRAAIGRSAALMAHA